MKGSLKPRMTAARYAAMLHRMQEGHFTYNDLVEASGLAYDTVIDYVTAMRTHSPKLVRIATFDKDPLGRRLIRVFELGNKPDARITPPTNAERYVRQKENRRVKLMNNYLTETA